MKRIWIIVLLLSLGLNVGLGLNLLRRTAVAPALTGPHGVHAGPYGPEFPGGLAHSEQFLRRRLDRMDGRLGLNESQRDVLWTLHREVGAEVFDRREDLLETRHRLHEAYAREEVDLDEIHRLTRQLSALQADLDSLVVDIMLREREVLTPPQRRQYRNLFPLGRDHQQHRRPGRHDGPRHGRNQAQ